MGTLPLNQMPSEQCHLLATFGATRQQQSYDNSNRATTDREECSIFIHYNCINISHYTISSPPMPNKPTILCKRKRAYISVSSLLWCGYGCCYCLFLFCLRLSLFCCHGSSLHRFILLRTDYHKTRHNVNIGSKTYKTKCN
jgi:hypothetical protein